MIGNPNNNLPQVRLLLVWHLLASAAIGLSSILFSRAPLWQLEGGDLYIYALVTLAYLASGVASCIYTHRTGSWSAFVSAALGMAALGFVFLVMLVTRMQYARSVLLQLFAIATILNLAPVVFRLIPRLSTAALAAAVAAILVLSIFDKGDLLRFQPTQSESRKVITTALYNVAATEYLGRIPWSATKGGGLAPLGEDLLLASGDGRLFELSWRDKAAAPSVRELELKVPLNEAEFSAQTGPTIDQRRFRVGGIAVQDRGSSYRIYASHHHWNAADACFVVRVSSTNIDRTGQSLEEDASNPWLTLFESTPCLGVRETASGLQPEFPPFGGHQMGGRLVLLDDQSLLVSIGDHRFDGFNAGQVHPQDPDSSYGKTVLIDLADNSSEIYSLGHRNPQGLAADSAGNVWLTEHGPQGGDELNKIVRGANYGWPMVTFGTEYGTFAWPLNDRQGSHVGYAGPIYAWGPGLGISALIVVEEDLFPLWQSDLLISTLTAGVLIRARIDEGRLVYSETIDIGKRIRDLVELANGTIVLWTDESSIITINPADKVQLSQAERGRMLFALCAGCHAVNDGKTHGIGPDLAGIIGRPIATADGYTYSSSLQAVAGIWTEQAMDAFLSDPQAYAPGNIMSTAQGVPDPSARAAIVEFLKTR